MSPTPQEEVARKLSGLEEHSRTLTVRQHNIYVSLFENKGDIFTKF
jgi:hypothetical protein